jgi:hypothetical protein
LFEICYLEFGAYLGFVIWDLFFIEPKYTPAPIGRGKKNRQE